MNRRMFLKVSAAVPAAVAAAQLPRLASVARAQQKDFTPRPGTWRTFEITTRVEILKVAHHGSADPGLGSELAQLRPAVAVISCGRNNDYGHPTASTVAALRASPGLSLYRTDEDGRVVVESDGRRISVRTGG